MVVQGRGDWGGWQSRETNIREHLRGTATLGFHIGLSRSDVKLRSLKLSKLQSFKIEVSKYVVREVSKFQSFKYVGRKVSKFQSFKVSKISKFQNFQSFKFSKFQSFKVSKFESLKV